MRIETGVASFDLSVKEQLPRGDPAQGDVEFRIRVRVTGSGTEFAADTSPWVSADNLATFVNELRRLERERTGEARLTSMSPGELTLTVKVVDRAGHAAISGQVGRHCFMRDERVWCTLPFDLELDPTELPTILAEFEALLM